MAYELSQTDGEKLKKDGDFNMIRNKMTPEKNFPLCTSCANCVLVEEYRRHLDRYVIVPMCRVNNKTIYTESFVVECSAFRGKIIDNLYEGFNNA